MSTCLCLCGLRLVWRSLQLGSVSPHHLRGGLRQLDVSRPRIVHDERLKPPLKGLGADLNCLMQA